MQQAEPPGQALPPADLRRRGAARAVDFAAALAPLLLMPAAHATAALAMSAALLACGDRLFGPGRSLGKRVAGLRCVLLPTRRPATLLASLGRNAIFVGALVPAALGTRPRLAWTLALLAAASLLELTTMLRKLTRDLGQRRLGDLAAGTQVVDASLPIELPSPARKGLRAAAPLASRAARAHGLPRSLAEDRACASP